MTPFDYLNSINHSKVDVMTDDLTEKSYNSFMINRSLSYFQDTVGMANVMNQHHHADSRLQYHFLLNIIRKRKRFSKWDKATDSSDITAVKEYYGYSNEKARQILDILSADQITVITQKISKGGKTP